MSRDTVAALLRKIDPPDVDQIISGGVIFLPYDVSPETAWNVCNRPHWLISVALASGVSPSTVFKVFVLCARSVAGTAFVGSNAASEIGRLINSLNEFVPDDNGRTAVSVIACANACIVSSGGILSRNFDHTTQTISCAVKLGMDAMWDHSDGRTDYCFKVVSAMQMLSAVRSDALEMCRIIRQKIPWSGIEKSLLENGAAKIELVSA